MAALEQVVNMSDDLGAPVELITPAAPPAPRAPIVDKYDEILEKIEDPNTPVADVGRLISIEIAKATRDMARGMNDPTMAWKSKAYADHIKALRDLNNQLRDTDVLSKKDMLNMDGPKFRFVLHEIAKLYRRALKESGVEPSLLENILRQFADLMSTHDAEIRREVAKIESNR